MDRERSKELVEKGLDQAFQEGIKWLDSLSGGEREIRDSNVVVVVGGGTYVEGMGLGPDKVEGVKSLSVNLRFPNGAEEEYSISAKTGLIWVIKGGDLQMDTMILGELPIRGAHELSDPKTNSWGYTPVVKGRYKLVYNKPAVDFSGDEEETLQSEEVKERKLEALEVVFWLAKNLA